MIRTRCAKHTLQEQPARRKRKIEMASAKTVGLTRPTHVRYLVLGILCLAAVIAYVHRSCLSVPAETIRLELRMPPRDMGYILGVFYVGYAIFQIPGGWLGGHWGTRLALTVFLAAWSASVGLMTLADGFELLFFLNLVNGLAQAAIFPCCVQTFAKWFPEMERAFPSGMLAAFMSVGAALASFLTGLLLDFMSWQQVLLLFALPGLAFAIGFYFWFRDHPGQHAWVNQAERQLIEGEQPASSGRSPRAVRLGEKPPPVPWRDLVTSGSLWLICGQQLFRAAGYVFYVTFFPAFLQNARNLSVAESGMLGSLPLLGVVLGSMTGGLALDYILRRTGSRTLSRKGVALTGVLGSGLFLVLAFFVDNALGTVALLTVSTFCGGLAGPAGYTITIDQGGRHVAIVFSIMNTAGNIGAALLTSVLPLFVQFTSWNHVLLFQASLFVCAGICWSALKVQATIGREQSSSSLAVVTPAQSDPRIQAARALGPDTRIQPEKD